MVKILVIENDTAVRENIVETLTLADFDVASVEDGESGVREAQTYRPDLILCDIRMPPGIDGYEVYKRLQDDSQMCNTPFIFLTALGERKDMRRGMDLGADDYIAKPFLPDELINAVNARLGRHAVRERISNEKLDNLRNRIIYNLPHELRTPLTAILGNLSLLQEDFDILTPEKSRAMIDAAMRGAARLERLVESYLLYAQLEIIAKDPKQQAALQRLKLREVDTYVQEFAEERAQHYNREADLQIELVPCDVCVSQDGLRRIITEIIDNAFKFSGPDSSVMVKSYVEDDHYVITIGDNGRGMSEDDIASIGAYMQFGRQLYEQQGPGLGLVIAKRLAELHNGAFEIESSVDRGTTCFIRLRTL